MNSIIILQNKLTIIEKEHYKILDSYIKGCVLYEDIKRFEDLLYQFRQELYAYQPLEEEIFQVAKMKSKIQHYYTEILEDEEILTMAHKNVYGYIEKL